MLGSSSSRADVYQSGVVVTSICAALALLSTIFLLVTIVWPNRATGSLKIQAWMVTFFSVWIFVTQIPYTVFVANRRAKVDAFLNGVQLPPQTVQAALAAAGESDKYSSQHPGAIHRLILGGFRDQYINFFRSCPSCHFPLDYPGLHYCPYRRPLHGCSETRTIGNVFSDTHV